MKISRVWSMPSIWTFGMKPVGKLFSEYGVGVGWVDPFAGEKSPAEHRNDIEGRGNPSQLDALEFLKTLPDNSAEGVLFDPPYSTEQCLRRYTPKHNGTAGRAEYWAKCKDEISRILKNGGSLYANGADTRTAFPKLKHENSDKAKQIAHKKLKKEGEDSTTAPTRGAD